MVSLVFKPKLHSFAGRMVCCVYGLNCLCSNALNTLIFLGHCVNMFSLIVMLSLFYANMLCSVVCVCSSPDCALTLTEKNATSCSIQPKRFLFIFPNIWPIWKIYDIPIESLIQLALANIEFEIFTTFAMRILKFVLNFDCKIQLLLSQPAAFICVKYL